MSSQRMTTWRRQENISACLMMIPALIPYLLFGILPILWVFFVSFTDYDGMGMPEWNGISNYLIAFKDNYFWKSVWNTTVFASGKLLIEIPLALVLAVLLNQKLKGSTWFRTIFFVPHVTSIAVMSIIIFFMFRPLDGVLNGILQSFHLIGKPIDFLGHGGSAMLSVIGVAVWHSFGLNTVLFIAGLQTIPTDVYESASIDGANSAQKMWYLTLPLLGPILKIVVMLAILQTMRSFDLIKVLTDGGPYNSTEVMFTYIFKYFFAQDFGVQYGYGASLGVISAVIIGIVTAIYHLITRRLQSHY